MQIEEAKKSLEEQTIFMDGVVGVGIIKHQNKDAIEISIQKGLPELKTKIEDLLKAGNWLGHPVIINETNQFYKH